MVCLLVPILNPFNSGVLFYNSQKQILLNKKGFLIGYKGLGKGNEL